MSDPPTGLPIVLQPALGPALLVGGGAIAARKLAALRAGGFEVTVVAPDVCAEIAGAPGITLHRRAFDLADIDGHTLVVACTDQRAVNRRAGELARARGIPVVVADSAAESTAHMPAVAREGTVSLAVATGGVSPGLARRLRDRLASVLRSELERDRGP